MAMKLYVGNLSFKTSSEDLQKLFEQAGNVEDASVVEDRETGRSRGFGFVEMATDEDAQAAIQQFNGKELNGRTLTVNEAQSREVGRGRRRGQGGRGFGSLDGRISDPLIRPEVKGTVSRNYFAQQSGGRVIIIATGQCAATNLEPSFRKTLTASFPPEYVFVYANPQGRKPKASKDFVAYTTFPAKERIDQVVVHDGAGRYVIGVLQVMENESIPQLFVNKTRIPIQGIRTNSLTPDACEEFNLDSVDMHTSQSDFNKIALPIIKPDTYSLICLVPGEVELTTPILAATCLRLTDVGEGNTVADVFVYDEGSYKLQDHRFSLDGVLGCTAIANLGFCLLKSLHGITTRALSTVTITDRAWIGKYEYFDLKVADDLIFDFCKGKGYERVPLGAAKRDCDSWTECKDLPEGVTCIHNIPKCK